VTVEGIDTTYTSGHGRDLYAAGKRFAMRYLGGGTWKRLYRAEAEELTEAGLRIGSNFESSAGRMADGFAAGAADAREADTEAAAAGMPKGYPIWFSNDTEATTGVTSYLDGCASVIGPDRVGIYGGKAAIELAKQHWASAHPGHRVWLWQTYAWSYGATVPGIDLKQYRNGETVAGVSCDLDYANNMDGFWTVGGKEAGHMGLEGYQERDLVYTFAFAKGYAVESGFDKDKPADDKVAKSAAYGAGRQLNNRLKAIEKSLEAVKTKLGA
jgi:hypothetical protein